MTPAQLTAALLLLAAVFACGLAALMLYVADHVGAPPLPLSVERQDLGVGLLGAGGIALVGLIGVVA